ncbi:MAG: hypothetical protein AMXMBFR47_09660 [Planctomycetota bacterium]
MPEPPAIASPPATNRSAPALPGGSDAAHELRTRYLRNLDALYRRDPDLAAHVDATAFNRLPEFERTRDGRWTVRAPGPGGRAAYLHSRHAPLDEARRLVAQAGGRPTVGDDAAAAVCEASTYVVHGIGLGYHIAALEECRPRPSIVVSEPSVAMIKAAMCAVDLADSLLANRLTILTRNDRAGIHERLSRMQADLLLGTRFVTTAAASAAPEFHQGFRAALLDFVSATRMQMLTLLRTSRVTFENIAMNLPAYLGSPGVESLAGRAAGRPAILVAAGPSLARNLGQLRELQDRAVIICVQTVFKLLRSSGVRPDFVTSLDFHSVSAEFFRDVEDFGEAALVAEPKATWHVPDLFGGPRHILRHRYHDLLLREANPARGSLRAGSTVAHLAFYLAEHLGCDPIILVGQDLAFTDGLFYMPGSPVESIWEPELGRFQTLEMKQWERIVRNRPILRRARSTAGSEVYTDDLLFTYAEQFQRDFAASRRRIIQASEGGGALEGAECLSLREAAARYCVRPLERGLFADSRQTRGDGDNERAAAALEARLGEVRRVREIAVEALGVVEALRGLLEDPPEFNRRVARLDELRLMMAENKAIYSLVVDVSATAELRRHQQDRRIDSEVEDATTAARRLGRDRAFVQELIAGCEFIEQVLPRAIRRLRGEPK